MKVLIGQYQKQNKDRLQRKGCESYQNLSGENKTKKGQYAREQYRNLSEDEKQNPVEYKISYAGSFDKIFYL